MTSATNATWTVGPKIEKGEYAGLRHIFAEDARKNPDVGSLVVAWGVTFNVAMHITELHNAALEA